MANLVELYDLVIQAQALNGVPLSHGHVYVYALGRTKLMDTWSDIDGESLNPNPVILDNAGQAHIYVSDDFDYTLVFTDEFDNEIFSVDKYLLSKGEHSHADVAVAPSEHIGVSSYHVGEVTVYVPYLTGEVGKVYEGIDPIVVNNDVNRISANHIPLGVQDPLYFVEDSETACIIGCSAQTEIPAELSGKWDNAADAVIANSAQWAEGTEYEAGSYVDIDGHTISVTGLQPEGDYAYNSALSSKLDVTALPQDLVHSGDLTAYQPAGNYLSATDSADFLLTSDSGNFYPMEGNPSGFLTAHQSLQGYATEQWVEDKGYLTSVDIPESATWNATTQTVSANSAQWAGGTANPQIPVTGINGIKISESGDQVVFEVSADYALADDLTGKQDSLTFGYKDTAISSIDNSALYDNSAHVRITTLAGRISDLSSNKLDTTAFSDVSGTFLTAHQDLSDYQTTADMTAYATVESLTAKQDAGDYLSATDSANFLLTSDSGNFYTTANESGFITGVDLTPYQLTADMTAYQPVGDYYSASNPSGFISEVPAGTMNESAFGYDANDKISGYNGSAFAGGSDVPEGVMVESGLEYNAVNEISAYNGSAIAQYGAEKQWLVHDDTLVHASNSAQYALGVNLSAVAQLLGKIDETVLWSGTWSVSTDAPTAITLSESPMNFERIKIMYGTSGNSSGNNISLGSYEYMPIGNAVAIHSFFIGNTATKATYTVHTLWSGTSGTNWTRKYYAFKSLTASAWNTEGTWQPIREVIGIGRRSNT
jgi:hypothetical protein